MLWDIEWSEKDLGINQGEEGTLVTLNRNDTWGEAGKSWGTSHEGVWGKSLLSHNSVQSPKAKGFWGVPRNQETKGLEGRDRVTSVRKGSCRVSRGPGGSREGLWFSL